MDALVKVDGKVIEAGSAVLESLGVTGLVSNLLGVPTDFIAKWRSHNLVRWFDKLSEERAARRQEGKPDIPLQLLIPSLRALSEEPDDDLLGLWAKLVAGFDAATTNDSQRKIYIQLLSQMTAVDAKLLAFLFSKRAFDLSAITFPGSPENHLKTSVNVLQAAGAMECSADTLRRSAANLGRIACLLASPPAVIELSEGGAVLTNIPNHPGISLLTETTLYFPTLLAEGLLGALGIGPETLNDPPPRKAQPHPPPRRKGRRSPPRDPDSTK